jgi:hypothetical protein
MWTVRRDDAAYAEIVSIEFALRFCAVFIVGWKKGEGEGANGVLMVRVYWRHWCLS